MRSSASEEFGKDLGLIHEFIVTGRKMGVGRDFYETLAHNPAKFKEVVDFFYGRQSTLEEATVKVDFQVWRTISLDHRFQTKEVLQDPAKAFEQAFEEADFDIEVSDWVKELMIQPEFQESLSGAVLDEEYELGIFTTAQITGEESATSTIDEVFNGADELELDECQLWMAPVIRLSYKDQPKREWLRIGAKPIEDSDGNRCLFVVDRDDSDRWLFSCYAKIQAFRFFPDDLWVFVRRKT